MGTQTNPLTLVNIKPSDAGEYRCVAVNKHGENYIQIMLNSIPKLYTVDNAES